VRKGWETGIRGLKGTFANMYARLTPHKKVERSLKLPDPRTDAEAAEIARPSPFGPPDGEIR
jgi:hypothetical protein